MTLCSFDVSTSLSRWTGLRDRAMTSVISGICKLCLTTSVPNSPVAPAIMSFMIVLRDMCRERELSVSSQFNWPRDRREKCCIECWKRRDADARSFWRPIAPSSSQTCSFLLRLFFSLTRCFFLISDLMYQIQTPIYRPFLG